MKTIKVYSASELKKKFPEGFEYSHKKWVESVSNNGIFWSGEIVDSFKEIFEASGITLKNYEISMDSTSFVKFTIPTYWSELADCDMLVDDYTGRKALNWIKNQLDLKLVVRRVNYVYEGKKHSRFDVTKLDGKNWSCEFTGVCFDHDFLDDLLESVTKNKMTLSEAYHHLADKAADLFQSEYDDQCSESYFIDHADSNDYQYTKEGQQIQYFLSAHKRNFVGGYGNIKNSNHK